MEVKHTVIDYENNSMLKLLTNVELEKISKVTNTTKVIQQINKTVDYKEALKSDASQYDNFGAYIFTKCDDLIYKYCDDLIDYLESNNMRYLEDDIDYLVKILLVRPTFNGFKNEQLNISLFEGMGYELYTLPSEELKTYDADYSIDHMLIKDGKLYGVQSKCGSFLNKGYNDKNYYYEKHMRALRENTEIKNIFYIFHDVSNPNEVLSWNKRAYIPNGTRYGDILIPTYNVVAHNRYNKPLIGFSDFRYLPIEEALKVWRTEESKRK